MELKTLRILDIYFPQDPSGIIFSYLFTILKRKTSKYKHTAKWIENNLIYGDTPALFQSFWDRDYVKVISSKASVKLFEILNCRYPDWRDFFNLLISISPFPGCIKKPWDLEDGWEELQQGLGMYQEYDGIKKLLKSLKKDGMSNIHVGKLYRMLYWENRIDEEEEKIKSDIQSFLSSVDS